ncbi:MAG: WhiB family transcriptional regulator [Iamia sp.]
MSAQRHEEEEEWQLRAACRGPHSAAFYPPTSQERRDEKAAREARAKEICRTCTVREPCLEYALKIRENHGIWGGFSESERRNIAAARA